MNPYSGNFENLHSFIHSSNTETLVKYTLKSHEAGRNQALSESLSEKRYIFFLLVKNLILGN